VRVYLAKGQDLQTVRQHIAGLEGVDAALTGPKACDLHELPLEGEADIVVIASLGVALGATAAEHDLSQLAGQRLRSHGGTSEQQVPFIVSHPVSRAFTEGAAGGLRNFYIFDYAINGVTP
jgi:phosphonoacetate hydrolase